MSSRNFASKRSIKPKNNWKIAAALNIDYITFICLSLHTSNCISAPETETYSKNLFDLIRFMWTDLNLNIYKIATKTHTLIISRNVLSVEHNIIRPLSYRSGIETLKIQKKFVKVNVECVVFSSVNSNKFVCFVLFCSPVQTWSKRPAKIAWEGDSIFYRLLDSIRLESNPACCCMVSDVNRMPLVVLGYIANSWTTYRLLNPNKTNNNFLI